uniref:helix-turn-helix domain-containing protein n=1 Tax=Trichloromonas sp. TaxID=3069249 RepID=UPI003D8191D5
IRANFLLDMEADRFDGFPGDAYLLGFLKLYAETLGLDAASVIDQFRAQTGIPAGGRERRSTVYDPPAAASGRSVFSTILLVVLLGGLTLASVYFLLHYWPFAKEPSLEPPQLSAVSTEFSLPAGNAAPLVVLEEDAEQAMPETPEAVPGPETPVNPQGSDYAIPPGGGLLRVEALGAVNVEALIDDLPLKQYALARNTVLSWRVLKSLQLQVDAPESLKVWLENEPLDLQGRSQLSLRAAPPAVVEEGR